MSREKTPPTLRPFFEWRSAVASRLGPPKPTTRHVLLTLGLHMSPKGDSCYPSIDTLAMESGLSRRAVIEHIAIAEAAGWISKMERPLRNGQAWRSMEYKATLPPGITEQTVEEAGYPPAPPSLQNGAEAGDRHAEGGDFDDTKVVTDGHPSTSRRTSRGKKPSDGAKAPSAVAECWKAYAEAIKARYGVEPPSNAKANGQLANIVSRVGAEGALQLVRFYVAHNDRFYVTVSHSLDYLVRDCDKRLWIEMGKQAGGRAAPAATKAEVKFEYEGGGTRALQDYPLGQPLEIARKCKADYGRMVASTHPKNIVVQIGQQAHRYSIAELDQGRTA